MTWNAGQDYYEGGPTAGAPRMFFPSGAGENSNNPVDGVFNLTSEGEIMFLNAVEYMLP